VNFRFQIFDLRFEENAAPAFNRKPKI